MEKKTLSKAVLVRLLCDECGEEMEFTGTSMGPYMTLYYQYKCPKCGATVVKEIKYPYRDFIDSDTPVLDKKKN